MKKLFHDFPTIEDFSIEGDLKIFYNTGYRARTFNIIVPTLLRLSIRLFISQCVRRVYTHKFVILVHNLQYLNIQDNFLGCFVVNETPFLSKAFVDVGYCSAQFIVYGDKDARAMQFFKGATHAKFPSLTFRTMAVILLPSHFI